MQRFQRAFSALSALLSSFLPSLSGGLPPRGPQKLLRRRVPDGLFRWVRGAVAHPKREGKKLLNSA
eukprot:6872821-Alexandrium_andersonii.AAC.1